MSVIAVMGMWGLEVQAADKTDLGPVPSEQNWQVGFTPSYSSGKFGTNTTSSFFYAPLSIRRMFKDGDVTLVIPFVTATSDGRATLVGGNPVVVQDNSGSNSGSGSNSCEPGEDKPSCLTGRRPGQKTTTAGLGDIILRGRYYAVEEGDYMPLIAVTGRMKLPTASASQGLGTGAFDYGAGIEISKMLGDKWIAFLDGGYNVIGDPEGINFQNQHWYDVGAGYYVTKDVLCSVYYEEYRAIARGFVNARDVFVATNYTASSAWRFSGGVTVGLSDGAPAYALTVGTSYRF
ncbi:MAG: transporter [Nitrospira sp.]|nr:transporter [Nitrospira sp.]